MVPSLQQKKEQIDKKKSHSIDRMETNEDDAQTLS
jgi:hypothetical protein